MTVRSALDLLRAGGFYDPSMDDQAARVLHRGHGKAHSPWYVQGLIGAGAWLAAVMFLVFFFGSLFAGVREESVFIAAGLVAALGAAGLIRKYPDSLFMSQFALAAGLSGQFMFAFGVGATARDTAAAAGALCLLELLLMVWCRDRVHLFVSLLIAALAAVVLIYDLKMLYLINLLVLLLASGCVLILARGRLLAQRDLSVIARALGLSLLGVLVLSMMSDLRGYGMAKLDVDWRISSAGIVLLLLLLTVRIVRGLRLSLTSAAVLGTLAGLLSLGFLSRESPGILAGLLVFVLGFYRNDRFLIGVAAIFVPQYLVVYYYNLDLTLLEKSLALAGPGIMLLVCRTALHWKVLPGEGGRDA